MSVPPSPMRHRQPSDDGMTRVELTWIEKRVEHWIRFGRGAVDEIVDRRRRIVRLTSRKAVREVVYISPVITNLLPSEPNTRRPLQWLV